MSEIWKDVIGYEGKYQVSNLGNVKSLPKKKCNYKGCFVTKEKILNKCARGKGKQYYFVVFFDKKAFGTHQLMAVAFLNHVIDGHKKVVDHINNDSLDNRLENLQVITTRENITKDKKGKKLKSTGVYLCKQTNKFRARIYVDGITLELGRFKTELEASQAYQNKLKEILCKD